jgi:TonB family protein
MSPGLALQNIGLYSLQVAILCSVAALLVWAFRLRAPRAQLLFWHSLLLLVLALPFFERWSHPPVQVLAQVNATWVRLAYAHPQAVDRTFWHLHVSWAGLLLVALAFGSLVRFLLIALGLVRLRRMRMQAEPIRQVPALTTASKAAGAVAEFLYSAEVAGPVTFGLKRPVVLLPVGFLDFPEPEQESVALHELLHVRRNDWLYTLAEEIIRGLLWFHPAVWFVMNRIQLVREQVVDEAVVNCTRNPSDYIGALLKIAASRIQPDLAPAPLFLKSRHLHERVAAIVKGATMSKSRLILTTATVLAALPAAAFLLALQFPLQASPQEVRDSPGVEVKAGPFKIVHREPVLYPPEALAKSISGHVITGLTVNRQGEVTDAHVVSGPEELRGAVLRSILNWHFSNEDSGVPPTFEIGIRFSAQAAHQPAAPIRALAPMEVNRIDFDSLPEALRGKLESASTLRAGDVLTGERAREFAGMVQAVDSHLLIRSRLTADRKVNLNVTLGGPASVSGAVVPGPERIRVGGNAAAMNLVNKVTPAYPLLAKQAHIQGKVQFQALIGKDGHIMNLELISGDPLLIASATDAVRQWVYRPVLLNGEPTEVITHIDVNYTLLQ